MAVRSKPLLVVLMIVCATAVAIPSTSATAATAAANEPRLPSTPVSTGGVLEPNAPPATIAEISQSKGTVGAASAAARIADDPVEGRLFGIFPRARQNLTTSFPSRAMVHIVADIPGISGQAQCSGWMISPSHVATAGHCVYSGGVNGTWYTNFTVTPGRNGADKPYGTCGAEKATTVYGWSHDKNHDYDYAVLKLNCAIGNTVGWLAMRPNSGVLNGLELTSRGYPGDKPEGTQWFTADTVRMSTDYRLGLRFDAIKGQSGSPIYRVDNRIFMAFAVLSSYDRTTDHNTGIRINQEVFNNYAAWVG